LEKQELIIGVNLVMWPIIETNATSLGLTNGPILKSLIKVIIPANPIMPLVNPMKGPPKVRRPPRQLGGTWNISIGKADIEYKIDYIVFVLELILTSTLPYPILLGRPCLYHTKAKNDWGKGILTLSRHENKLILQMSPIMYHG
jgi:hypothetical protein